ncbi:hypothetical protein [Streptomyces inhibens]|nr:hypothetical protein [Streptomyces inhibens]
MPIVAGIASDPAKPALLITGVLGLSAQASVRCARYRRNLDA